MVYRGKVILSFYGTHSQFCPVKNVDLECCHLKNRQCICIPTINRGFHYSRCKPGNKYIFSLQKDTGSRIAGLKERNILLCIMRELRVTDLKELEKIESYPYKNLVLFMSGIIKRLSFFLNKKENLGK